MVDEFTREGFEVILSIGEAEENRIGSNCGQFTQRALRGNVRLQDAYEVERYQA